MPVIARYDGASAIELDTRPFYVTCERSDCYLSLAARSEAHAHDILDTHNCPVVGGTTTYGADVTLTTVEQCWDDMDKIMDIFMVMAADHPEKGYYHGQLRGMSMLLARFMGPHFRTADEIAKEAGRRYKARKAGDATYQTAGLATLKYTFPDDKKYAKAAMPAATGAAPVARSTGVAIPSKLSEGDRQGIKGMLTAGMFTPEQLAKTYSVTTDVIKAVAAL